MKGRTLCFSTKKCCLSNSLIAKLKKKNCGHRAIAVDFQPVRDKMHAKITLSVQWCAMCIFLFLEFYNFIKGIGHMYIVFLKKFIPIPNLLTCSNIYNLQQS